MAPLTKILPGKISSEPWPQDDMNVFGLFRSRQMIAVFIHLVFSLNVCIRREKGENFAGLFLNPFPEMLLLLFIGALGIGGGTGNAKRAA